MLSANIWKKSFQAMIIKKKNKTENENEAINQVAPKSSGNIIKAAKKVNPLKQKAIEKKDKKETFSDNKKTEPKQIKSELEIKLEEYEKIDVSVLEYKERYERRRGERRRGFRRIDERTLVSRAQEEARNIREVALQEGYKNGLNEARGEIEMLKNSLVGFVNSKNEVYDELTPHILEIALEIAKKIIKKEVELSNDVLKSVIKEVFSELNAQEEKITIKVNPEDVEFAKVSLPEILEDAQIEAKISVVGDETIEKGSCTVIASNGVVDANFSTQLSIIQNAFGIYNGGQ